MSSALMSLTLFVALGQSCPTCNVNGGGGAYYGGGMGIPAGMPAGGAGGGVSFSGGPSGPGQYDPLYPYDYYDNWVHGHFQEIPAYGGYFSFRPYNYRHVLSQSQVAAGWGMGATLPYSHEYFRRMREQHILNENRISSYDQPLRGSSEMMVRGRPSQQPIVEYSSRPVYRDVGPGVVELPAPELTVGQPVYQPVGGNQEARIQALQEKIRQQQLQLQMLQQGSIPEEGNGPILYGTVRNALGTR